jgi:hypothetical protein
MKSILQLDIGLSQEYEDMIDDLLKFTTFYIVSHLLVNINQGTLDGLFNWRWVKNLLFILIGLAVYHMVIKKLFQLVYTDDVDDGYVPTIKMWED